MNGALPWLVVTPLATGVCALLLRRWPGAVRAVSLLGVAAVGTLAAKTLAVQWGGAITTTQLGGWPAPFGITLVADRLSSALVMITAVILGAAVVTTIGEREEPHIECDQHGLLHFLAMGVVGAFVAGDLFNLYVWFEVMLLSSFGLLSLGHRIDQMVGAVQYVTLNLIATVLFLLGVGLLYGLVGTLNMAHLHGAVASSDQPELVALVATLCLVAFGLKAAVFPLFFWLPASYHTPGIAVSAIFSGLLTKVGVYALMRALLLIFPLHQEWMCPALLVVALATMVVGVVAAAAQVEIRRILSFHIVSQIGYMVLGLALMTPLSIAATVFYLIHHIVVKANLFLVSGLIRRVGGTLRLDGLGGLSQRHPFIGLVFGIPAMSLAGVPPLSGFWAKLLIILACFEADRPVAGAVALAVSLLTIFSMTKIWLGAFWGKPKETVTVPPLSLWEKVFLVGPTVVLGLITVAIGLGADPLMSFAREAAGELINPAGYLSAVLEAPR